MTRDLVEAKNYFGVRHAEASDARYGLIASARDKILAAWGIPNDWHADAARQPPCLAVRGRETATGPDVARGSFRQRHSQRHHQAYVQRFRGDRHMTSAGEAEGAGGEAGAGRPERPRGSGFQEPGAPRLK